MASMILSQLSSSTQNNGIVGIIPNKVCCVWEQSVRNSFSIHLCISKSNMETDKKNNFLVPNLKGEEALS